MNLLFVVFIALSIILQLVILNQVFSLRKYISYELSVFDTFMRTRINAFLDVFKKSKGANNE